MPQQTVYIREDDLSKWKSIKKKADLMHWVLSLEPHEIEEVNKLRAQRARSIQLPAGGEHVS